MMIVQGVMYRKIFGWKIHDPIADEAIEVIEETKMLEEE
jgi:hypothetical protein